MLEGLEATATPFLFCPSFGPLQFLPLAERVAALRDPALRERILREHAELMAAVPEGLLRQLSGGFDVMFRLTDPVDYELDPSDSLAAAAARANGGGP